MGKLAAQRKTDVSSQSPSCDRPFNFIATSARRPERAQILPWLPLGAEAELRLLADLLVEDPPWEEEDVPLALPRCFKTKNFRWRRSSRLLTPCRIHLAAGVLDLANFVLRQKLVKQHPAASIGGKLTELLGQLVGTLGKLTEQAPSDDESMAEIGRQVAQSVSLAVSLCDALALIGDQSAVGKLHQAMDLGHRRLRTEAAAALARLGESHGKEELIKLAAEPVARLRVLAYAKELGVEDKINQSFDRSRAEAERPSGRADPVRSAADQMWNYLTTGSNGPASVRAWNAPVSFTYELTVDDASRTYSNIGIAGPLAHAFTADLGDLSPDDIMPPSLAGTPSTRTFVSTTWPG